MGYSCICVEDTVINLDNVTHMELNHREGTKNAAVRVWFTPAATGIQQVYRDFNGTGAEAMRNWARSTLTNLFPDRVENTAMLTLRPARSMAAGGSAGSSEMIGTSPPGNG